MGGLLEEPVQSVRTYGEDIEVTQTFTYLHDAAIGGLVRRFEDAGLYRWTKLTMEVKSIALESSLCFLQQTIAPDYGVQMVER